ncbi:MAG: hypothetical protein ACOX1P_04080 [Thermoguttaceae bacterium]|jgi:hypothetical protein
MATFSAFLIAASALLGQTEAKQTALPDRIAKELGFFVGEWVVEGDLAGKALTGRWSARWARQRHCLLISSLLILDGERVSSNGISGWDAGKKELVTVQFFSNGVLEDTRYQLASPGVMKGVYTVSAEGEPLKVACEVQTNQPKEWTFKSAVNVFDNKKQAEFTIRFVRSEAQPKKDRDK